MKKFTLIACCVGALLLTFVSNTSKASHAAGAELIYEWVSDSTYRFYFKFYRDCTGAPAPRRVQMCYTNTCTNQVGSIFLDSLTGTLPNGSNNGTEVATGCANQPSTCESSTSAVPGYREWWYSDTFRLPVNCDNWRFSVTIANRNTSVNLVNGIPLYVETTLYSVTAPQNSSPVFSVKPVPYVCINSPYRYNNGGVDPNGDSVAFQVINPLDGSTNCNVAPTNATFTSASPSYSIPSNPFQTNNTFNISASTGELTFTPGLQGAQTVTVRANEYRNGNLIGSVMRDIQVQVLPCNGGGGTTPTLSTDGASVSGSATFTNGTVYGCATQQFTFCFDAKSTDPNAILVVSDNSGAAMPGATVTYTNLQTDSVRGCVTWTPNPTDTGTRVFVVTVKDSACASNGVAISHSFTVPVYVWAVTAALKDTAICVGDSTVLTGVGGTAYIWSAVPGGSGTSSLSCTNCKSPIAKPSTTTSYIVTSNSSSVCNQNTDTVTVTVIQQSASGSSNSPVCPGNTLQLFGTSAPNLTYIWTGPNGFTSNLQNPTIPNAQSINSGTYGVRVTNGTCTSAVFNITVYVGPPAGPAASSNSPVCRGSQLFLTASTVSGTNVVYNWTGPNGYTSNQQNPIINNVALNDSGKYFVNATIDGCVSFSDSVTVKVNDLPPAPVANPDTLTYCQDVTASPLTASGTNLKWYTVSTGGTGVSSLIPSTTTAGVFKYYVSQTSTTTGCEGPRDSVSLTVIAKPSPPTVTNVTYCQGDAASPLTANGTNLKWYTVATGGSPLGSAPTPPTNVAGSNVYFVSQTSNSTGCESDRAALTVTVLNTPAPPVIFSPVTFCQGGNNVPPPSFYVNGQNLTWYTQSTGGTGTSTAPTVNTSVPSLDTYYISQTVSGCEGARGMMVVEVIATPAAPLGNDTTYCQFESPVAVSATGQNLLWYNAPTGGTGSNVAPTPSTASPGIFNYYVSQTIRGCEGTRDTVTVTVYAKPQPPVGDDDSICEASMPNAITATGQNLIWYTQPVGGSGSSTAPIPSTANTGTFFWYVTQSINGCESDRDTVEIEVVPKPAPPLADSAIFCLNGPTMQLTAVGQNLLWYTVPVGGFGSNLAPTPSTASLGVTVYYVSQTVTNCESDRDTLTVVVDTLVTADIMLSKSVLCLNDTLTVTQTGQVPDTAMFTWTWDGGTIVSGDTSGPFVIQWDTAGTKTITLAANDNGCRANDTTTVEVLPLPEVAFDAAAEICANQELEIVVNEILQNAVAFSWAYDTVATTIVSIDSNKIILKWEQPGTQVVSLYTVSDSGCVSQTITDTITVRDYPKPQILPLPVDNNIICTKAEINVGVTPLTNGQYMYKWTPAEYFITNNTSSVVASIPSAGYIKVSATDMAGCTGTDSVHVGVKLCCEAVVPNAFSPNGDGRNDKFGIVSPGNYKISAFKVVNRYGQVVFSTTNQQDRWDGTMSGTPQSTGTYYYYIKYSCDDDDANNEVESSGDVILIK